MGRSGRMGSRFRVGLVLRGGRRLRGDRRVGLEGKAVVLRTMPTSQNRDMGHPVLWLGGKMVVLRTITHPLPKAQRMGHPVLCLVLSPVLWGVESWRRASE